MSSFLIRMGITDYLKQNSEEHLLKKDIDGQMHWHHSTLSNWDKNKELRILLEKDWLRLLKSIKKHGVKDVFEISENGTVYDGNHRLRAINELISEGITTADNGKSIEWVPVTVNTPQNEVEELQLAMKGNDKDFAIWNKEAVANNKEIFIQVPDFEDYSFDFNDPVTFGEVFASYDEVTEEQGETSESEKKEEQPIEIVCPHCHERFIPATQ